MPASRVKPQRLGDEACLIVLKTHGGRIAMRKKKPSPPRATKATSSAAGITH